MYMFVSNHTNMVPFLSLPPGLSQAVPKVAIKGDVQKPDEHGLFLPTAWLHSWVLVNDSYEVGVCGGVGRRSRKPFPAVGHSRWIMPLQGVFFPQGLCCPWVSSKGGRGIWEPFVRWKMEYQGKAWIHLWTGDRWGYSLEGKFHCGRGKQSLPPPAP